MTYPKPMLADELPKDDQGYVWPEDLDAWAMEPKFDGWRFLLIRTARGVMLLTRGEVDYSGKGGGLIEEALMFLPIGTVLDCEICVPGEPATSVSSALSMAPGAMPLQAYVFDVLRIGDQPATHLTYDERRELLIVLGQKFDRTHVVVTPTYTADPELHEQWVKRGIEGSVLKLRSSKYEGKRSRHMLKVKPTMTAEATIIGWVAGQGQDNKHLCGALRIRLLETEAETQVSARGCPFEDPTEAEKVIGRMVTITHYGKMRGGLVRHPVSPVLRPDREKEMVR